MSGCKLLTESLGKGAEAGHQWLEPTGTAVPFPGKSFEEIAVRASGKRLRSWQGQRACSSRYLYSIRSKQLPVRGGLNVQSDEELPSCPCEGLQGQGSVTAHVGGLRRAWPPGCCPAEPPLGVLLLGGRLPGHRSAFPANGDGAAARTALLLQLFLGSFLIFFLLAAPFNEDFPPETWLLGLVVASVAGDG